MRMLLIIYNYAVCTTGRRYANSSLTRVCTSEGTMQIMQYIGRYSWGEYEWMNVCFNFFFRFYIYPVHFLVLSWSSDSLLTVTVLLYSLRYINDE